MENETEKERWFRERETRRQKERESAGRKSDVVGDGWWQACYYYSIITSGSVEHWCTVSSLLCHFPFSLSGQARHTYIQNIKLTTRTLLLSLNISHSKLLLFDLNMPYNFIFMSIFKSLLADATLSTSWSVEISFPKMVRKFRAAPRLTKLGTIFVYITERRNYFTLDCTVAIQGLQRIKTRDKVTTSNKTKIIVIWPWETQ